MNIKKTILSISALVVSVQSLPAASVIISNLTDGPGDALFADASNVPLPSGYVWMGYFNSTITASDIDSVPKLQGNLANFTVVTSAPIGVAPDLGTEIFSGYAQQAALTSLGAINDAPLLGRTVYAIVTFGSNLLNSASNSQFGLWRAGILSGDTPVDVSISANPKGVTPIIGSRGTVVGDFAGPNSGPTDTFATFKLVAVPEPSSALIGALGVLGFLRRRRN
jgi:PEP-CTERM motif